jgi:hypothetical protein
VRAEISRLAQQSVAGKTYDAYIQAQRAFQTFRNTLGYGEDGSGVTAEQVAEFIAWLSLQNRAAATISAYVAGISFWHKINLLADPTDNFLVKKLLSGARRGRVQGDVRRPITGAILRTLISALKTTTKSGYECILFEAAFTLAFFGFLRLGEFTSASKRITGADGLSTNDVVVRSTNQGKQVCITLRKSKNNQFGQPQTITIAAMGGDSVCPVRATESYIA